MLDFRSGLGKGVVLERTVWRWIVVGLGFVVVCSNLVRFTAGESAEVRVHDNLDGLISHYVIAAKHSVWAAGSTPLAEFPEGVTLSSISVGFDFWLIPFKVLSPFWAYVACKFVMMLTAFWGVLFVWYVGLGALKDEFSLLHAAVAVGLATFFASYPHFGLTTSSVGTPLVIGSCFAIIKGHYKILSWIFLLFYGWSSSLLLSGLFMYPLVVLLMIIPSRAKEDGWLKIVGSILSALIPLSVGYMISHWRAIYGVLIPGEFISHRNLWRLAENEGFGFVQGVFRAVVHGNIHAVSFHECLIVPTLIMAVFLRFRLPASCWIMSGYLVLMAILNGAHGYGFIGDFQSWIWNKIPILITRGVFLNAGLWIVVALIVFDRWNKGSNASRRVVFIALFFLQAVPLVWKYWGFSNENQTTVSWNAWYNTRGFEQVKSIIAGESVACIGFHPAQAQYSGLSTIGFYSSNYDVKYKNKMRRLIAPVLREKDGWRFDEWGSRCYPVVGDGQRGVCRHVGWDWGAVEELNFSFLLSNSCLVEDDAYRFISKVSDGYWPIWIYQLN